MSQTTSASEAAAVPAPSPPRVIFRVKNSLKDSPLIPHDPSTFENASTIPEPPSSISAGTESAAGTFVLKTGNKIFGGYSIYDAPYPGVIFVLAFKYNAGDDITVKFNFYPVDEQINVALYNHVIAKGHEDRADQIYSASSGSIVYTLESKGVIGSTHTFEFTARVPPVE